ncbi:unknown [Firmicutes bacterium CAG:534]|nr:unknown [Firmicutes bacterium CAG:534]
MTPNYTKHDTCVIVDNFVEMGDFSKNYPFLFVDRKMEKEKNCKTRNANLKKYLASQSKEP